MSTQHVDYDDLVYTDEHVFVHEGKPFTGVAEERFPDGQLRCVFPFEDGKEHGDVEEFFPSGLLMARTPYVRGVVHGRDTEWFEDGGVKVERDVEFGILMRSRTMDASGAILDEFTRSDDDGIMETIKLYRKHSR